MNVSDADKLGPMFVFRRQRQGEPGGSCGVVTVWGLSRSQPSRVNVHRFKPARAALSSYAGVGLCVSLLRPRSAGNCPSGVSHLQVAESELDRIAFGFNNMTRTKIRFLDHLRAASYEENSEVTRRLDA